MEGFEAFGFFSFGALESAIPFFLCCENEIENAIYRERVEKLREKEKKKKKEMDSDWLK